LGLTYLIRVLEPEDHGRFNMFGCPNQAAGPPIKFCERNSDKGVKDP
jgi:hypothetical protein